MRRLGRPRIPHVGSWRALPPVFETDDPYLLAPNLVQALGQCIRERCSVDDGSGK
jgi:hypothetical protein